MSLEIRHTAVMSAAVVAVLLAFVMPSSASATGPTKFVLTSHIGRDVNKTKVEEGASQEARNECELASGDTCQRPSFLEGGGEPREFEYPESVGVAENGDFYVADRLNSRVQEFDSGGHFILMFGWNVNKTKLEEGAPQSERNVCTQKEREEVLAKCQAGQPGVGLAGQLNGGQSIAVDAETGNVYVLETAYKRVEEFTATGEFVLMVGRNVNKKGGNVCTKSEESECQAGVEGTEHGAFEKLAATGYGNLIAVGPTNHLLYVGDEGRVQEFKADGTWVDQVSLAGLSPTATTTGVAVDKSSDLFVIDSAVDGVHEYSPGGVLESCVIDPTSSALHAIAIDPHDRIGVLDLTQRKGFLFETQPSKCGEQKGGAIAPPSGEMAWGNLFSTPSGLAFSDQDMLYVAVQGSVKEVEIYTPIRFPEVATCATTEVTATSALLCGEVNPEGLETKLYFEYGTSLSLGSKTAVAFEGSGEVFESVDYTLTGLVPNQTYYDEAVAEAEIKGVMETTDGPPPVSFHTTTPPPQAGGEPHASFVQAQTALLSASVNPEHAVAHYHFEYGPCQELSACVEEDVQVTEDESSSLYSSIGVAQEARNLTPQTLYAYRLVADNGFVFEGKPEGGRTIGAEGQFTTARVPKPRALTGGYTGLTATSVVISATVDPDGQPATYAFELGVDTGSTTRYGVVVSGPVGAGVGPVGEKLTLSGLQPGTAYAYRVSISSGFVTNASHTAYGEPVMFTTEGVAEVLHPPVVLEQLPVPAIPFPKATGKPKPTRAQELARALKVCAKKPKRRRAACRRKAVKRFAPAATKNNHR
jgi:hypothetical protein